MVLTFSAAAAPPASGGGLSLQSSAGGAGGSGCTWQPPAGSSIGAAAVAEQAVLLYCTGGAARHLIALLPAASAAEAPQGGCEHGQPAGHVTLTQAAALPMAAEVSCVSNLLLAPAQRAQHGQQAQQHSAVFAVGTYSSAVLLVQLQWGPQQQGSLQLLLTVDLTSTSAATGLASAAATAAAAAGPLSPRSFQREQLTPESLLLLPAEASASSSGELHGSQARSGGSGGGGAMVPGAASLVAGLRTGALLQLHCAWGCGQQQQPQEELLSVSLGHMPVVILPLPRHQPLAAAAAAGAVPPAAAVLSDRVSLLRYRPAAAAGHGGAWGGAGRVSCQQLALPQVQAAAALLLDSGGLGGSGLTLDAMAAAGEAEEQQEAAAGGAPGPSGEQQQQQQQQLFLLCAAADGCLRMVSLESQLLAATRCWPLRQLLQPSRLAVHEGSGSVVVAGACTLPHHTRRGDEHVVVAGLAAVQAVDPATGESCTHSPRSVGCLCRSHSFPIICLLRLSCARHRASCIGPLLGSPLSPNLVLPRLIPPWCCRRAAGQLFRLHARREHYRTRRLGPQRPQAAGPAGPAAAAAAGACSRRCASRQRRLGAGCRGCSSRHGCDPRRRSGGG